MVCLQPSRLRKNNGLVQGSWFEVQGQQEILDAARSVPSNRKPSTLSLLGVFQHPARASSNEAAGVAELVDARVSKTREGNLMRVRFPPPAYTLHESSYSHAGPILHVEVEIEGSRDFFFSASVR